MLQNIGQHPHSRVAAISLAGYFGEVLRRLLRNAARAHLWLRPTFSVNCKQKQSEAELATRWITETPDIGVKASVYNIGWRSAMKNWLEDEEIAWNGEQMMCGHSFKVIPTNFLLHDPISADSAFTYRKSRELQTFSRPINAFSISVSWDLRCRSAEFSIEIWFIGLFSEIGSDLTSALDLCGRKFPRRAQRGAINFN